MCKAVYIASDHPLPLIEWQENVTPFCVTELSEPERVVKKHFTKPFVVYAGAYEGCSCGFSYEDSPIEDEEDARVDALSRESVRQLAQYVSNAVKRGTLEMFACWEGDQGAEPEERLTVTPAFFGGREFSFKEKQFLVVA